MKPLILENMQRQMALPPCVESALTPIMDWSDTGIVLSARKHGETSVIVSLLTSGHGRHLGLVRGGAGRRSRGVYQAGNVVAATWKARLEEHLGSFTCEMTRAVAVDYLDDPMRLAGLSALAAVTEAALPEREPHDVLYRRFTAMIDDLKSGGWLEDYVSFELELLAELGFGLDLSQCAATGETEDLIYVSPKSGRAVSRGAGAPYKEKLLPLPAFLVNAGLAGAGEEAAANGDILDGLALTGHFLERHVFIHRARGGAAPRPRIK
jgi:DNA repair protein RecO (recombination protein O)